jgi:hypothetical protein
MKLFLAATATALTLAGSALAQAPASAAAPAPLACKDDPLFRQQDYIVGRWNVIRGPTGTVNTSEGLFELALSDCTIKETWTPLTGPTGHGLGLLTYSRIHKAWNYFWAADSGATTHFKGTLIKPGEMRYETTAPLPNGGTTLRRLTLVLLPDGRIRKQLLATENGGKTWREEYDLYLTKKP